MMKFNFIFLVLTCAVVSIFGKASLAGDTLDVIDYTDDGESNLYLTDPSKINEMHSITYLVDGASITISEMEAFKYFSDIIGANHGGVFLSLDDKKNKIANKIYASRDHLKIIDFISNSSCQFLKKSNSYIVFEAIKDKKCFYFDIKKGFDLAIALGTIKKNINNYQEIRKNEFLDNADATIDSLGDGEKSFKGIKNELKRIIRYLISL